MELFSLYKGKKIQKTKRRKKKPSRKKNLPRNIPNQFCPEMRTKMDEN
jgi:hypothetical protein